MPPEEALENFERVPIVDLSPRLVERLVAHCRSFLRAAEQYAEPPDPLNFFCQQKFTFEKHD